MDVILVDILSVCSADCN